MNTSHWAVGFALLVGSIRAVVLWRSAPRVDVVNVVVLTALAQGRAAALDRLLRRLGAAPYFEVARTLALASQSLDLDDPRGARQILEREATAALVVAHRALGRARTLTPPAWFHEAANRHSGAAQVFRNSARVLRASRLFVSQELRMT